MNIFKRIAAWFRSLGKRSGYCSLCGSGEHKIDDCRMLDR